MILPFQANLYDILEEHCKNSKFKSKYKLFNAIIHPISLKGFTMNISLTGRNIELTDAIKQHMTASIEALKKYNMDIKINHKNALVLGI